MTPEVNLILTALLTDGYAIGRGINICEMSDKRIAVWLPGSRLYDPPDGMGDSVSECLEDAAYRLKNRGKL